jgi:radical SAM superfamily enzyme YgiQ (UPF0313 family)
MKRVLLVNPWIYDFSAFDLWLKPLGLLYIAAFLEGRGYEVEYLDCMDRNHPFLISRGIETPSRMYGTGKFFAEEVGKPQTIETVPRRYKRFGLPLDLVKEVLRGYREFDAILVTSIMTYWYQGVSEMITLLRERFPGTKTILGGVYPSLLPEHAGKVSGADVIIEGREISVLLEELGETERTIYTQKDFYDTCFPAYHLYSSLPSVSMITTLGCPFRCPYCVSGYLKKDFAMISHEKILNEIEGYVEERGVKDIAFYDDALLYRSEDHFIPLFEKVIQRDYGVRFHTPNGINARFITVDVAEILFNSGFRTIRIGFESSSEDFQRETGMKVTNEEISLAVSRLLNAGFERKDIGIYIMAGRRDEGEVEVRETLRFVERLGTKVFISEYSPVPGSREWEQMEDFQGLDPLWQNNSIAYLKNGWTMESMQRVKDVKDRINHSIFS